MIQTELLNDGKLIRHWSDIDMMIRQIEMDIEYADAVDVVPCKYTYEETNHPINPEEPEEENMDKE